VLFPKRMKNDINIFFIDKLSFRLIMSLFCFTPSEKPRLRNKEQLSKYSGRHFFQNDGPLMHFLVKLAKLRAKLKLNLYE